VASISSKFRIRARAIRCAGRGSNDFGANLVELAVSALLGRSRRNCDRYRKLVQSAVPEPVLM